VLGRETLGVLGRETLGVLGRETLGVLVRGTLTDGRDTVVGAEPCGRDTLAGAREPAVPEGVRMTEPWPREGGGTGVAAGLGLAATPPAVAPLEPNEVAEPLDLKPPERPARDTGELPAEASDAERCALTAALALAVVLFFENIWARESAEARFFGTAESAIPASFIEGPLGFTILLEAPDLLPEPPALDADGSAGLYLPEEPAEPAAPALALAGL
jgi:hypothetical protein